MNEVVVKLQKLHKGQSEILNNAKRFNHLRCGRRFGKTSLIEELCLPAIDGFPVGVWFPTYKDLSEVWKSIKYTYRHVVKKKKEDVKQLELITGGIIDLWSMDNPDSGQGRYYKRAIIDEAAKTKNLYQAWEETIRPTLTDLIGDAWILSRPKGYNNGFYKMEEKHRKFDNWAFFHYTTYDNPFMSKDEIEEAKNQLDSFTFEQEYMAEYVDANSMPFLYSFERDRHVGNCSIDESSDIRLSFDFNIDPFTVTVYQRPDKNTVHFIDYIRLGNSDIYQVCDHIRAMFPNHFLIVTGDASGGNRTGMVRGKSSYWYIIKQELRLKDAQIRKRSKNIGLIESRVLCNSALQHKNILINPKHEELIRDCVHSGVDDEGILKKDRQDNKNDFLDGFRYALDMEFPELIRNPKNVRKN
jgi:hypothetical protein